MTPESGRDRPFLEHSQIGGSWDQPWGWTVDQAAALAAVPPRQLRFWAAEILYPPDVWLAAEPDGWYSSAAVLMLRCLRELIDAGRDPWAALAMCANLAADYDVIGDDDPDWTQPRFLDVRTLALRDDWLLMSSDRGYLESLEPNAPAAVLVARGDVDGDDWTPGHGRFRRNGDQWAWPIATAARELLDAIDLLCRRQIIKRLGAWQ